MKIKKLRTDAILPHYAHEGDGCFDISSYMDIGWEWTSGRLTATIPTGIAYEVPDGYTMFVFSRSGHGFKHGVTLVNCVGVIDSSYRGELIVKLTTDATRFDITKGTRVAQACIMETPKCFFDVVDELSDTERGEKGFGSSDRPQ